MIAKDGARGSNAGHGGGGERGITDLERRVYGMLARVPKGKVTTYGELARAVGLRNGQRAIGRIMNRNPYPVIIPCHRVVMSTGDIGGYAHGKTIKQNMLGAEGVRVSEGRITDMKRTMHVFEDPAAANRPRRRGPGRTAAPEKGAQ